MGWVRLQTSHRRVVFLASAVAAAAHLGAAFEHRESSLLVAVFVSVAVVQLAAAVVFVRAGGRRASLAMAVTTVVLLAAWVVSRTVGLPIGHSHGPERAAALDITATAAQVLVLLTIVRGRSRRATSWRLGVAAFAVALAVVGLASRSHVAPADHHSTPYASTPEPASVERSGVPSPTPAAAPAPEAEAVPADPSGHAHCSGAGCAPHAHP